MLFKKLILCLWQTKIINLLIYCSKCPVCVIDTQAQLSFFKRESHLAHWRSLFRTGSRCWARFVARSRFSASLRCYRDQLSPPRVMRGSCLSVNCWGGEEPPAAIFIRFFRNNQRVQESDTLHRSSRLQEELPPCGCQVYISITSARTHLPPLQWRSQIDSWREERGKEKEQQQVELKGSQWAEAPSLD